MEVKIKRTYLGKEYTIGHLYLDGKYFCDTLEDVVRPIGVKVPGETAIPYGIYPCAITYSPRFKKKLPEIMDVPHFTGVRIHSGNTAADSEGCILVGENKVKGKVINSRATLKKLLDKLPETFILEII